MKQYHLLSGTTVSPCIIRGKEYIEIKLHLLIDTVIGKP